MKIKPAIRNKSASVRSKVIIQLPQGPAEFISFSNLSDGGEHFALVFGERYFQAPLVRIHSECMTGDVFGSKRCDCGPQLTEALNACAVQGGLVIYLRQEGRGIGLYNKLDAYLLQDKGLDTFQANERLGFHDDLRNFEVAGEMLHALNISKIRLLTNNPAKVTELSRLGIEVTQIRTGVFRTPFNQKYLQAKITKTNHSIQFDFAENK